MAITKGSCSNFIANRNESLFSDEDIDRPKKDGEPCSHRGCLNHISHPCEGCGRIGGRTMPDKITIDKLKIRDLVAPIDQRYSLVSGCSEYNVAVVVSIDPFVLVSFGGDMRWQSTVSPENFSKIGMANDEDFDICVRRLNK